MFWRPFDQRYPENYFCVNLTEKGEIRSVEIDSEYYSKYTLKVKCNKEDYQIAGRFLPREEDPEKNDLIIICVKDEDPPEDVAENPSSDEEQDPANDAR